jgi:TolA-binding protein
MTTHLVKHQKLTKRQIKEDPLVTAAFHGTALWEEYGTRILIGLGALALVALLAFFVAKSRTQAEQRAAADLYRAGMALQQGDPANAAPMLKEIVDNSPGTPSATKAMLYLGDAYARQGKSADAIPWYRKYLDKAGRDPDAKAAGHLGLATALEDHGDFAEAAEHYAAYAKGSKVEDDRARYLMAQARCLVRAGQIPKALEIYRSVITLTAADASYREAARERASEYSAKPTP